MSDKTLRIAILHYLPKGEEVDPVVTQITEVLGRAGHEVVQVPVDESVTDMVRQVEKARADLVFNVCETFADDYRMEVNVAALMELAKVPFTGSGTAGLLLAQDKILAKQLLEYNGVMTPRYGTFDGKSFETKGNLTFPLIVKPAKSDASIGLAIEKDVEGLAKRVKAIREEFDDDALVEEYIEGREVYAGVIGNGSSVEVLPVVELDFGKKWSRKRPKIANRAVKFGPDSKDAPRLRVPQDLSEELRGRIQRAAMTAFRALKLRDYAGIDFRVSSRTNEPYVLEVNPNPYLESECEVALGARVSGLSYEGLILRIVESAATRYGLFKGAAAAATPKKVEAPKAEEVAAALQDGGSAPVH